MTYQIRQFGKPTTLNQIIEYTIIQLAKHPLLGTSTGLRNSRGELIKVVKFRNFSGVELKERGLTLSVYPYSYEGAGRPTPESRNTSISFMPYGLMGTDPSNPSRKAIDLATANIKLRLDMLTYSLAEQQQTNTSLGQRGIFGTNLGVQTFESNEAEGILRDYAEYVRLILVSDLFNLHGMIRGSAINWVDHVSSSWDKAGNLILHTAELMWQVYYNPLRSWRVDTPVRSTDTIIGTYQDDGSPVFWKPDLDVLVTGFGQALLTTPTGLPITWNPETSVLINPTNQQPLSPEALRSPENNLPFINLDLLPVGVFTIGDIPLYFKKTTNQLVRYDGTQVTNIPGPDAALTVDGALDVSNQTNWIPVAWDAIGSQLVYGVGHPDVGKPVQISDLKNPATNDLYLIMGDITGIGLSMSPNIREFVQFPTSNLGFTV